MGQSRGYPSLRCFPWTFGETDGTIAGMRKSDVTCPNCKAGYRRIELMTRPGNRGEFRCLTCNHLFEVFDGSTEVALRLTVQPEKTLNDADNRF